MKNSNGFNEFMKNPYWRNFYENAPGENLKKHIHNSFEYSYSAAEQEYQPEYLSYDRLTKEEVQYLYDNAASGQERAFLRKWLHTFDGAQEKN